jgi:hypothetical protein
MKAIVSATCILALSATAAVAEVSTTSSALASGRPAGVHHAQLEGGTGMLLLGGAALVGMGLALATASNGPGAVQGTSPTTTATATTTGTGG